MGDLVMIGLSNDTGIVLTIVAVAANNGQYPWTIPVRVAGGVRYRIMIKSLTGDSISGSSGLFTIINYADAYEPDNQASLATPIDTSGTIQYHNLTFHDTDWYTFEAHEGWSYCIRTYGTTNTFIDLFATDSHTLLLSNDNGGSDSNAIIIWTCPSSGHYYFRITETGTSRLPALPYSVNVRTENAILALTYPDSGSTFVSGSTVAVQWQYSLDSGNNVSLFVYRNDSLEATIVSGAPNNGNYSWIIPHSLPTSPRYRIKIVSGNDSTVNDYSGFFTITYVPASFSITTPSADSHWNTGTSADIHWTYSGDPGPVAGLALYDGGSLVTIITSGTGTANGQYSWNIPSTVPTSSGYRIKITSVSDTTVCAFSTPFTITKIPSTLTIKAPSSTANWNTGATDTISWASTGNPGSYASLALYNDTSFVTDITLSTGIASGNYFWTIPLTLPTSSTYRIKITSTSDASIYGFSNTFSITHIPPINVTAPRAGATWNAGSSNYLFWTSNSNVPGSFVTIYLYDSTALVTVIASDVNRANGNYYWTPLPATLRGGSKYRIQIVSTADITLYGYSGYFTIAALPNRLTITTPDKNSIWTAGDYYTIYWSYSGGDLPGSYVKLDLYNSSSLVQTISSSTYATNGLFSWQIPPSLASNSQYRIKITSTAIDTVSDFSDSFTITNPALIGDAYEPDSTPALAKPIVKGGPAQSHTLSDSTDEDYLKFVADSGTTYTIETQGSTDTYLNLYGMDGVTLIASDDDISGTDLNARIVWTCPQSGTYYFEVAGWDVGSYTVTLR
jgi:hypothetical protein